MPKQETDIFNEHGKFKMQRWGFSNNPDMIQIRVVLDEGWFYINVPKNKPCSSIKKMISKLYETRKEIALSYKEHYKEKT